MKVTWAFIIDSDQYYGEEAFVYGGHSYTAKIIHESFSGVTMRVDIVSKLIAPNECSFDLSNTDDALDADDFEGVTCTVTKLENDIYSRSWTFVVKSAVPLYGKIHIDCIDPISDKLEGQFPDTPNLSANFPSDEVLSDDTYRIPITFGTAFIPCAPFLKNGLKYHCLGKSGTACTIIKVRSPREWDLQTEWDNSYTYAQSNIAGEIRSVRGTTLIIADSDGDGTVDANGVWNKSGRALSPLIQFYGAYSAITHPGEWLSTLLQLFGVSSGLLNAASFTAIDSALSGVTWGGGFWEDEDKETLLASTL